MLQNRIYYCLKPVIPRTLQILLRRELVNRKRLKYTDQWPILKSAAKEPLLWNGWPQNKRFALVLTHDVEQSQGQRKCCKVAWIERQLGFRSSFNLVPRRYAVSAELRNMLQNLGFEIGVHDYNHDGKLFSSYSVFKQRVSHINSYLRQWNCTGFRAGAMFHNLEWIGELDIEYDCSTFDTDPFEPQPDAVETIFPFLVKRKDGRKPYVELPYTLAQDFTLFIIMGEKGVDIWKRKLDWIVENGGMALINTHPDYMNFNRSCGIQEYPAEYYEEFLRYVKDKYEGEYWHALPGEVASYSRSILTEKIHCDSPRKI